MPESYAVCMVLRTVSSTADDRTFVRSCAPVSGVAGSLVLPMTRIGGAPTACGIGGVWAGTGQSAQARLLLTTERPSRGATAAAWFAMACSPASPPGSGPSRQPIAKKASWLWS